MGYRDDLKLMPAPGSPDGILQQRKTILEMPRYKIAQDKDFMSLIFDLFDLQSEVSKEAQSLTKMICTSQSMFWDTLKLSQRLQTDSPFSWDLIFKDDIKQTMYALDIMDSFIKQHIA